MSQLRKFREVVELLNFSEIFSSIDNPGRTRAGRKEMKADQGKRGDNLMIKSPRAAGDRHLEEEEDGVGVVVVYV